MAPEWEAAMGMELGMGTHYHHHHNAPPPSTAAPSLLPPAAHHYHYYGGGGASATANEMRVDDLLDLSSHLGAHDFFPTAAAASHGHGHGHGEPTHLHPTHAVAPASATTNSSSSFNLSFADEFYMPIPTEEAAELEWLSNFVDDSYPDVPTYPPAVQAAMAAAARNGGSQQLAVAGQHEINNNSNSVSAAAAPASRGARSKRSRAASAAAAAWHALVPRHQHQPSPSSSSSSSDHQLSSSKPSSKNKMSLGESAAGAADQQAADLQGGVRRCTHCASEKTPQWRTGPLGPKTLCNACGVRYKSGRLVPEYRPAASPTFVLTQHSNSHRKVMELRRQNELIHIRGAGAGAAAGSGGAGGGAADQQHMFRDYGVC